MFGGLLIVVIASAAKVWSRSRAARNNES